VIGKTDKFTHKLTHCRDPKLKNGPGRACYPVSRRTNSAASKAIASYGDSAHCDSSGLDVVVAGALDRRRRANDIARFEKYYYQHAKAIVHFSG
jgi:hypothetical protein